MDCEAHREGDDTVYPVTITVTSVDGDQANQHRGRRPAGGHHDTTAAG